MRKNYKFFKKFLGLAVFLFLGSSFVFGQIALMHSYTFEEGTYDADTVYDVVGNVNGAISGSGDISDGIFTTMSDDDIIVFDGEDLGLNAYSSITLEAMVTAGDASNPGWTMLAYFGAASGSNALWLAIARNNDLASAVFNGTSADTPDGGELEDGNLHHVVAILTSTNISLWIDGQLIAEPSQSTPITNLDPTYASLLQEEVGAGWDDPAWKGSLHEFNIYEGELHADSISAHATAFLGETFFDATLSSISSDKGVMTPAFDPETFVYSVDVEYGITSVVLDAVSTISGASVSIEDGLGNEIVDGVIEYDISDDGMDCEITVTALNGINQKIYQVSVDVNPGEESALLSSIDLSAGVLLSEFDPLTTDYTAILPYGTTSVDVTANTAWSEASVSGDGTIDLSQGSDTITIAVTSEDGATTKDYSLILYISEVTTGINLCFVHETSGFIFAEGENTFLQLQAPFNDSTNQVFQLEESGLADQYFIKSGDNRYIRLSEANTYDLYLSDDLTTDLDSCRFIIHEIEPGRFLIESVIKSDNAEGRKYMGTNNNDVYGGVYSNKRIHNDDPYRFWNIKKQEDVIPPYDLYLSDLTFDVGALYPEFDIFTYEYYAVLPEGTTSVNISATTHDETSSVIAGTGAIDVSAGEGTIAVKVAGSDQTYTKDYTIQYQVNTPLTLKHSYTFEDGTAQDQVGEADGIVLGDHIQNGIFTSVAEGDYISLPGETISMNAYPSVTVEAYIATEGLNIGKFAMLAYFGGSGGNGAYFLQPTRQDNQSATGTGYGGLIKAYGPVCDDIGENYHMVSVLTYDTLYLYINGVLQSKVACYDRLRKITTENAYIGKSGFNADPNWLGSIYEFNIYTGEMDEQTIATRFANFPVEDSTSDATLSDLMLGGETIEGFAPYTLEYIVEYPAGTTTVPAVTATARYEADGAAAVVTDAATVPDTAIVVVTAIDGTTTVTYNVIFRFESATDLSDLTVNGTTIEGFDPDVHTYEVKVIEGSAVPTVEAVLAVGSSTLEITPATEIPGSTVIVVTADDGEKTATYTVNFVIDAPDDATLSDLTVNGITIEDFDPTKVSYVVCPDDNTIPTVVATVNDTNATAEITPAATIPGTTTIIVTAGDGKTFKTYLVNFDCIESIDDIISSAVNVYPTVFKDNFRVESSELINSVKVIDVAGKVVYQQIDDAYDYTIFVPAPGIYMVEIISNDVVSTYRVFKVN